MPGKGEFVDQIVLLTGLPKTQVALSYDTLFELMTEALARGEKVAVPNFGSFQISERPARQGRNPSTGETIEIAASKTVRFKVSRTLRDQL
jgi:DNA-binding protein HU-beta